MLPDLQDPLGLDDQLGRVVVVGNGVSPDPKVGRHHDTLRLDRLLEESAEDPLVEDVVAHDEQELAVALDQVARRQGRRAVASRPLLVSD